MSNTDIRTMMARAEPYAYAALRFIAGAMFAFHGAQKILGWHGGPGPAVGSQLWVGGLIELLGGAFIALGLFTRPAAFLACGEMAVAYLQFHWKFATDHGMWLPTLNKGELSALYCFVFLFVAAHGAGVLSLDALLHRQRHGDRYLAAPRQPRPLGARV